MADKNEEKGKDPLNNAAPFSEEQVAFLCTLLEEWPQSSKGKEPAKKLTNETEESGECVVQISHELGDPKIGLMARL